MRENEFREWMSNLGTMQVRPIGDAVSRCRRVVRSLNIDLDEEYAKDRCISLLKVLDYTTEDARNGLPADPRFGFEPGANIKNGMASLRAAVNKYIEFCDTTRT